MSAPTWTDADILRLRALWADGMSTAAIGRAMDITKNAVVGKVHRLDLPKRANPVKGAKPAAAPVARRVGAAPTLPPLPAPIISDLTVPQPAARAAVAPIWPEVYTPAPPPVPTVFLPPKPRQCQWLEGKDPPYRQCRTDAKPGKSWCDKHYARVFVRRRPMEAHP